MDAAARRFATLGLLLAASAVVLPWAKTGPDTQAVDPVSGFGNGLEIVLILTVASACGVLLRNRAVTFLAACIAALWMLMVMYELPGTLLSARAVGIAEISWGAFAALVGSLIIGGAACRRPPDPALAIAAPSRG
jgi:hypothetical protein